VAFVALSLLAAHFTRVLVENPGRLWRPRLKLRYIYAAAAVGMAVVVLTARLQVAEVHHISDRAYSRLADVTGNPCFGSPALDPRHHCPPNSYDDLALPPAAAQDDSPNLGYFVGPDGQIGADCSALPPKFTVIGCTKTATPSRMRVELIGNSHAGHLAPAVEAIADAQQWTLTLRESDGCTVVTGDNVAMWSGNAQYAKACAEWGTGTLAAVLDDHPDLAIFHERAPWTLTSGEVPAYEARMKIVLTQLADAGIHVAVVRDVPAPEYAHIDPATCISENASNLDRCDYPLGEAVTDDPSADAAEELGNPDVREIDLTPYICLAPTCSPIVGNVIAYTDDDHLSATFSRTLAPYLFSALVSAGLVVN
jgi:hypothetical protein